MIQMLKKYYTKSGRIVIPLSFSGGMYNCRMTNDENIRLRLDEMFEENPRRKVKVVKKTEVPSVEPEFIFDEPVTEEKPKVKEAEPEIPEQIETEIDEIEEKVVDKNPEIQDNIEETADDFYADL